jgi:site-specific DNA-methyltransferase (adenine-specific)
MDRQLTAPATPEAARWSGWGTALKPAWEPIALFRKPLIGTVAQNVIAHGVGALNIDGCRVPTDGEDMGDPRRFANSKQHEGWDRPHKHNASLMAERSDGCFERRATLGRWPANVVHDGSDEVMAEFPDVASGMLEPHHRKIGKSQIGTFDIRDRTGEQGSFGGDSGSAARFFASFPNGRDGEASADDRRYTEEGATSFAALPGARRDGVPPSRFFYAAKADGDDRVGSKHTTVKPLDLMQWLVRLVTPPGGLVLDPFAGTGTTGEAAWREGMRAVLIEAEPEYQADIARRMAFAASGPMERAHASVKAGGKIERDPGPLFANREAAE